MGAVIKVENLSKQYRLGKIGTGSLSHDLNRWWYTARGKEDPYLKIGEANDRSTKGESEYVWSLRDLNFDIEQGDAVGIIGRNGAGKSTLLKILSRVTGPTTGSVKVKGRIASLLEVGTGFHPELSGRENIFLNGAILGMRKHEIQRKFDEIVDFSGVERYIDTPVKRYSSGMYVRLAFAVAAHLESEILIVDEVLAVGDAEFQKKCLGKMNEVSKGEGRTILFVSHNMASIQKLCSKGILLENGAIRSKGIINDVLQNYLESGEREHRGFNELTKHQGRDTSISPSPCLKSIKLLNRNHQTGASFTLSEDIIFEIEIDALENIPYAQIKISIDDFMDTRICVLHSDRTYAHSISLKKGYNKITCCWKNLMLVPNAYKIKLAIAESKGNIKTLDVIEGAASFEIVAKDYYGTGKLNNEKGTGFIIPEVEWIL